MAVDWKGLEGIDLNESNDAGWWMYSYKVQPCPLQGRHDWSTCPNAHRGERAARRCPRSYAYAADQCPEYSKTGACAQGSQCPLAHSVFESWLHPTRFRTQLCCFGASCRRRICFFAHDAVQLRAPTQTASSAAASAAAAAGAPVLRRTQAVVPASMMGGMFPSGTSHPPPGQASPAGGLQLPPPQVQSPQLQSPPPQQQQQQQQGHVGGHAAAGMPQQQLAMAGGGPWLYMGPAGWVPAGPMPGQAVLMPMAAMPPPHLQQQHEHQQQQQHQHQHQHQHQQQHLLPLMAGGSLAMASVQMQPGMPMDASMVSGLAAGLQAISLQDASGLSTSCQPMACPMVPGQLVHSQQGSGQPGAAAAAAAAAGDGARLVYAARAGGAGVAAEQQLLEVAGHLGTGGLRGTGPSGLGAGQPQGPSWG